jgi:hypothetical protein
MIVPGMVCLTFVNLVIGIAGSLPISDAASQWVIVVFIFLWWLYINLI